MNPVQLLLALHAHPPTGATEAALQHAVDRAYRPFLETVARHPAVRLALHLPEAVLGHLEGRPQVVEELRGLVSRGQVELLAGALDVLRFDAVPERDALGQLETHKAHVAALFGQVPRGLWLPSGGWVPELPRLMQATGLKFTFVDDRELTPRHPGRALRGYFAAEKAGVAAAVFPRSSSLGETIPFAPARELLLQLEEVARGPRLPGGLGLTFGAELERFGLWPRSHAWCFERGKLDELFRALADLAPFAELLPPSEYLARFPPQDRATVRPDGDPHALLAQHPELDVLRTHALHSSQKLAEAEAELAGETDRLALARHELYRGQSALDVRGAHEPAARAALHAALIRADNLIDAETRGEGDFIEYEEDDLDADLRDEALLANAQLAALIDPDEGGALLELDFRPLAACVTHVPTRREEPWHARLSTLPPVPDPESPPDGPELLTASEPDLASRVVTDGYPRFSFIDRFHAPGFGLEQLQRGGDGDVGDFAGRPYTVEASGVDEEGDLSASVTLVREGTLAVDGGRTVLVEKTFHVPIDAARLEAEYILENPSDAPLSFTFAPELNLTLQGAPEERYLLLPGGLRAPFERRANHGPLPGLGLIDEEHGIAIELGLDREAEIWSYPVETVNLRPEGYQRVLQGLCLLLRMAITLPPRESARILVKLELAKVELEAEAEPAAEPPGAEPAPGAEPTPEKPEGGDEPSA